MKPFVLFLIIILMPLTLRAEIFYLKDGTKIETSHSWTEDLGKIGYWTKDGKTRYLNNKDLDYEKTMLANPNLEISVPADIADKIDKKRNTEKAKKIQEDRKRMVMVKKEARAIIFNKLTDEEKKCFRDLQCWGDTHLGSVATASRHMIEKFAKFDCKWTDGLFDPKYSEFKWKDSGLGILTYYGDKIKFQNGFGAWQNYIYECDYDAINDKVLDIRVYPGRL